MTAHITDSLIHEQIEAAAKVLAEGMDYPWEPMPEQGRKTMRALAVKVVEAALTHAKPTEGGVVEATAWRCFHCDETFTTAKAAQEHFGKSEYQRPGCQIDVAEYRRMEEVNRRHCEEDTDLHRAIYAAQSEGAEKARRAEEEGYSRGLKDAPKNNTMESALRAVINMAEACKEPCGTDPESPAAIRNGKFASIALIAAQGLGWARASLPAQAVPARWMPIESAPRKKTVLVGYWNLFGLWRTLRASYYRKGELPMSDDYPWDDESDGFAPEGWYEEAYTHETIIPLEQDPVMWHPLPAAPQEPSGGENEHG